MTNVIKEVRCFGIQSQIKTHTCTHTAVCAVHVYWEHWGHGERNKIALECWRTKELKRRAGAYRSFLVHLCQVVMVSADLAVVCVRRHNPPNGPHPWPSCIKHGFSKRPTPLQLSTHLQNQTQSEKNHNRVTYADKHIQKWRNLLTICAVCKGKQPLVICIVHAPCIVGEVAESI